MPRSNRPRRRSGRRGERHEGHDDEADGLARLRDGWRRTEVRRGVEWTVQPISRERAAKTYRCPGCGNDIEPGVAHVAAWRADGILGDASALADRRHWHNHCWRIA